MKWHSSQSHCDNPLTNSSAREKRGFSKILSFEYFNTYFDGWKCLFVKQVAYLWMVELKLTSLAFWWLGVVRCIGTRIETLSDTTVLLLLLKHVFLFYFTNTRPRPGGCHVTLLCNDLVMKNLCEIIKHSVWESLIGRELNTRWMSSRSYFVNFVR